MAPIRSIHLFDLATYGFALLCIILLSGCGYPRNVGLEQMMPPSELGVARLHDVAVIEFSGDGGVLVANHLAGSLRRVRVDGREFFTIRGPARLESRRARSDSYFAPAVAIDHARRSNARGVLVGQADIIVDEEVLPPQIAETCLLADAAGICLKTSVETTQCIWITVTLDYAARALDAATGRSVYDFSQSRLADSVTECDTTDGDPTELVDRMLHDGFDPAVDLIARQLTQTAANTIHEEIVPHPETFFVAFLTEADRLEGPLAEEFEAAAGLVTYRDTDAACDAWRGMARRGVSDLAISYNLAACDENEGRYLAALNSYGALYRRIFQAPVGDPDEAGVESNYDRDDWAGLLAEARERVSQIYDADQTMSQLGGQSSM